MEFLLHFDAKRLPNHEYQIVCQQKATKINVGILKCKSGSSDVIFNTLKKLLDECDA